MKLLKLATATLLALGVSQAYADHTNLVQNVSIQLFGVRQGRTTTSGNVVVTSADIVRVDTRRVIEVLGTATANNFSSSAKLVIVSPLAGGSATFEVRDGATKVNVSAYIVYQQVSDAVHSSRVNTQTGRSSETDYSIQRLALQDADGQSLRVHFDVNGFTTQSNVNSRPGDDVLLDVSGSGDRNEHLLILRGSIGIFGHALETVTDNYDPSNGES